MNAVLDARSQSMFKIDESTGLITTTIKLDREFMSVHYLKIFAAELSLNGQEDPQNSTVQKSASITLQVNVVDVVSIIIFLILNLKFSINLIYF